MSDAYKPLISGGLSARELLESVYQELGDGRVKSRYQRCSGIYFLRCPYTRTIRYVGSSRSLLVREKTHYTIHTRPKTETAKWTTALVSAGIPPIFEVALLFLRNIRMNVVSVTEIENQFITDIRARQVGRILNVTPKSDWPVYTAEQAMADAGRAMDGSKLLTADCLR